MSGPAPASPLRHLLEKGLSQLLGEADGLLLEARERARREMADQLNQAVRRIRQSADFAELAVTVTDASATFASGVILFTIEDGTATCEKVRLGVDAATGVAEDITGLEIPLASASALAGAVAGRDPVIAVTTPGEVSAALVERLDHPVDGRVSVFPIVAGQSVEALVYAWNVVDGSALELISQVASATWSQLTPVRKRSGKSSSALAAMSEAAPELVTIAPAALPKPAAVSWEDLPATEQEIHLRAQRFARVQTAEMRLRHADAVQSARLQANVYESLRRPIDSAREMFRRSFFATCPTMVDYLHLEVVRTLANDDPELLGKDYPGPLV